MERPDFTNTQWRKSDVSGDGGCVEVAHAAGWIGVRDSKDKGSGAILAFTEREWGAFLAGVAGGEFHVDRLKS